MYMLHECSCPWKPAEGISVPGAGVTGGGELLNLGAANQNQSLEEQRVPSTTELPLQAPP